MFCFQAEDGIRDLVRSRGLGDVYKRQVEKNLERLTSDRKLLDEQLEEFKELDDQWTRLTLSLIHI